MVHAFFKALLFLAGGAVILMLNEEHDIFKMGGLRKKLPVVFWVFLIGSASLAALPLVTAGFYSKDAILWFAWSSEKGSPWLWLAGMAGAFITSLYTFRLVFLVFFGEARTQPGRQPGKTMVVPMVILAVLSLIAGFIELPESWGNLRLVSHLLDKLLPAVSLAQGHLPEALFQVMAAVISLSGIYLAYRLYYNKPSLAASFEKSRLNEFFYRGWDFDRLYDFLFVKPVVWLSEIDKNDFIDLFNKGIAGLALFINDFLSLFQNGKLRWYLLSLALGIVLILTIMMNL